MSKRFEVGLGIHTGYLPLQAALGLSKQGEGVGFGSLWVPEALGSVDAVSVLGALTQVTRRPKLGPAVAVSSFMPSGAGVAGGSLFGVATESSDNDEGGLLS